MNKQEQAQDDFGMWAARSDKKTCVDGYKEGWETGYRRGERAIVNTLHKPEERPTGKECEFDKTAAVVGLHMAKKLGGMQAQIYELREDLKSLQKIGLALGTQKTLDKS